MGAIFCVMEFQTIEKKSLIITLEILCFLNRQINWQYIWNAGITPSTTRIPFADSWIDYYYLWCRLISPWYFDIFIYIVQCGFLAWIILDRISLDWFIVMSSVCHLRSASFFLVTSTRSQSLIKLRWFPGISPLHLNNSKKFFYCIICALTGKQKKTWFTCLIKTKEGLPVVHNETPYDSGCNKLPGAHEKKVPV